MFAAEFEVSDAVDVRRVLRRVPVRAHDLPDEVAKRCVGLVAELGLRYAALDLIRTPDDEYVFLDRWTRRSPAGSAARSPSR